MPKHLVKYYLGVNFSNARFIRDSFAFSADFEREQELQAVAQLWIRHEPSTKEHLTDEVGEMLLAVLQVKSLLSAD